MIKQNCRIVLVLPHEADALDSCFKNVMPEGWKWGDNVYQRLEVCNIPWLEYGLEYDPDRYGDADSVSEMATTVSKRKRVEQMAKSLEKEYANRDRLGLQAATFWRVLGWVRGVPGVCPEGL
eukprot:2944209-Karenia_brevis.AAC.1